MENARITDFLMWKAIAELKSCADVLERTHLDLVGTEHYDPETINESKLTLDSARKSIKYFTQVLERQGLRPSWLNEIDDEPIKVGGTD